VSFSNGFFENINVLSLKFIGSFMFKVDDKLLVTFFVSVKLDSSITCKYIFSWSLCFKTVACLSIYTVYLKQSEISKTPDLKISDKLLWNNEGNIEIYLFIMV
jgi:hypothetical protein